MSDLRSESVREPEDEPLDVAVIGGRLVISIGVRTLAFAVMEGPENFHRREQGEPAIRITDPLQAAKEIAAALCQEDEEGTTAVHDLLDHAGFDAWENGGDGFTGG